MTLKTYIFNRLRTNKLIKFLFIFYMLTCISSIIYFGVLNQYRNSLIAFLIIFFFPAIIAVEYYLKLDFANIFFIMVIILILGGTIYGPGYDFYMKVPKYDNFLHLLSGIIFCCFGFAISERFFNNLSFSAHLFISVLFSLSVGFLWEMIEMFGTFVLGIDMQEDMIINKISSFLLANSHNDIVILDDITKTIIYYGDNQQFVIDGYLDIGLYDTLIDMFICLLGTILYLVMMIVGNFKSKKLYNLFVPQQKV